MRSVDPKLLALLITALALLGGCASAPKPTAPAERTETAVVAPLITEAKVVAVPAPAPVAAEVQAQFDRALQLQRSGRTDEAFKQWTALAQAHPELGGVHANIGLIHRQAGRHAEAVAALERAVRASPTQARFFNELGIAYRSNGQFQKAQETYEYTLALDPNHGPALLNLAILHDLYLGNGARALELYDRYLSLVTGGDTAVTKWAADLRQRKPAQATPATATSTQVAKSGKELP